MPARRRAAFATALSVLSVLAVAHAAQAATPAVPISSDPRAAALPQFIGAAAVPLPVFAPDPPAHPFMAPNGLSNIHDDAYQTNTYQGPGPLGRGMRVLSTDVNADCASVTFDSLGRLVAACVGTTGATLRMFDPATLATLASFSLPPHVIGSGGGNPFQDFSAGGYFYLDNHDRAVIPTSSRHIFVVGETGGAANPGFALVHDYDVSSVVAATDRITSALPDWSGRIWFVSFNGVVGTVDPASGAVRALDTHEEIENSFAVDESGGVFIVSIRAMYRFDAAPDGAPSITWSAQYPNSHIHKPGQVDAGSGTTPLLLGPDWVAITDNADPMDIVVYRRTRQVTGARTVCVQPVFSPGASDSDNSLVGADNAMIVENNYGYTGPSSTMNGAVTAPGIERVDINASGQGCHPVWTSAERSPTVVPKLTLSGGLVYAYTKEADPSDPWYFAALDFQTGRTVYKRLAGGGVGYNNNYAPISLGPDGSAYVGVIGGLVELRDASPPPNVRAPAPAAGRPPQTPAGSRAAHGRLVLHLRRLRSGHPGRVRAAVTGPGVRQVRRVVLVLGKTRLRTLSRAPWVAVLRLSATKRRRLASMQARVTFKDGTTITLRHARAPRRKSHPRRHSSVRR
jgi:hypothetical protein